LPLAVKWCLGGMRSGGKENPKQGGSYKIYFPRDRRIPFTASPKNIEPEEA